jgi:hypothetical protein
MPFNSTHYSHCSVGLRLEGRMDGWVYKEASVFVCLLTVPTSSSFPPLLLLRSRTLCFWFVLSTEFYVDCLRRGSRQRQPSSVVEDFEDTSEEVK